MREYHYITHEDCTNICKAMNNGDPNKSMVIISAPKGTTVEVGEEEEGDCLLKMDATGKGDIKVYTCKASTGVKELEPKKS